MTRRKLAAVVSAFLLSLACSAAAHAQAARGDAPKELLAGARAYREGRFAEAEQHFRRVQELDPSHRNAQLFIARAVERQYKSGVDTPENVAAGERAVAEYQLILNRDPQSEFAYKAVVSLYAQMKREDRATEMITARANDFMVSNAGRAEAFILLANRQWLCSRDVTESKETLNVDEDSGRVSYQMPADAGDFVRARQCADEGLRLIEQAVSLDPNSPDAWSYKANLLRELSKLAEMEGDAERKAEYDRQREEAFDARKRAAAEEQRKARAGQKVAVPDAEPDSLPEPAPTPAPDATPEKRPKLSGGSFGVFNGKAVSKPEPEYPAGAKAALVQGAVTVFVVLDEAGNVEEAEAVGGHALPRDSAVAAARRAKFSPTLLSGRPARNKGVVTYSFVLR